MEAEEEVVVKDEVMVEKEGMKSQPKLRKVTILFCNKDVQDIIYNFHLASFGLTVDMEKFEEYLDKGNCFLNLIQKVANKFRKSAKKQLATIIRVN